MKEKVFKALEQNPFLEKSDMRMLKGRALVVSKSAKKLDNLWSLFRLHDEYEKMSLAWTATEEKSSPVLRSLQCSFLMALRLLDWADLLKNVVIGSSICETWVWVFSDMSMEGFLRGAKRNPSPKFYLTNSISDSDQTNSPFSPFLFR